MDLLVLEELLARAKSFAALLGKAVVLLPADFILHDVGELLL